jgi:HSP20 family protein
MPWDPMRDLLAVQDRLGSLFGRAVPGWVPAVDLYEAGDRYVLTVELPGCTREDVQVEMHDDALVLRGARPAGACPDRFQQLERGQGVFSRSFRFGQAIRSDSITADLADGVLTIVVPKVAAPDALRIPIA